jgi:hypothetical protein
MKKAILVLAILPFLFPFTSCYTSYTCTCGAIDSSTTVPTKLFYKQTFHTESQAMDACSKQKANYQNAGYKEAGCTVPI